MNKYIKKKQTPRCREVTSDYHWGKGTGEGQDVGRGLRDRNYYIKRYNVSDSLGLQGLYPLWDSPGQNTAVGSRSLLQGSFPTQGLNSGLLHCGRILYELSVQGSPSEKQHKAVKTHRVLRTLSRLLPRASVRSSRVPRTQNDINRDQGSMET